MADYTRQVAWILRQERLTAPQLMRQYTGYKDQREVFESGCGTVGDMTALITPGVAAMLDLEDRMLADLTADRPVGRADGHRATLPWDTIWYWCVCCLIICAMALVIAAHA